jgi:predicted dinucleotide-utilizing enzyme
MSFDTQEVAIGLRDAIAAIADKEINALRPQTSYAVVQTINREARSATVLYMGDTTPVSVAMGSIEPTTVGQTVRIGGTIGHRYLSVTRMPAAEQSPSTSTILVMSTLPPIRRVLTVCLGGTMSEATGSRSRLILVRRTSP